MLFTDQQGETDQILLLLLPWDGSNLGQLQRHSVLPSFKVEPAHTKHHVEADASACIIEQLFSH